MMETLLKKANGMPIVAPLHTYVRDAIKALGITAPNLHIMPTQSYLLFRLSDESGKSHRD